MAFLVGLHDHLLVVGCAAAVVAVVERVSEL